MRAVRLPDPRRNVYERLFSTVIILALILVGAASLYHFIGQGRWEWFDCLYMTVITLSTVGYGETLEGFDEVRWGYVKR